MAVGAALLVVQPAFAGRPAALSDWPMYGADLSGTRCNSTGPSETQLPFLRQVWRHSFASGDVTGTPGVAGGRVFAASDSGLAVALDAAAGQQLWTADLGGPVNSHAAWRDLGADRCRSSAVGGAQPGPHQVGTAVSLSNGVLYAASSTGLLQAWDAATGVPLISLPLGEPSFGGVSIGENLVFAATGTSFGSGGSIQAFGV